MSQILIAEYDDDNRTLRLPERLEGIRNHAAVRVVVDEAPEAQIGGLPRARSSWAHLEGCLSKEAGDSLAEAMETMFPPWREDSDRG